MTLPSGVDHRGGTLSSRQAQSERCWAGADGAIVSEPSPTCFTLGTGIGGERPSDPQLPVRWGLLPFSWGPVPVHSDVHVSVLSAFAIDASQGYIREKRRCARLSGLGQILPFLVPCISPNSGFLGLKAPVCSSRTGEETPRSLGKVRQSPPFFL